MIFSYISLATWSGLGFQWFNISRVFWLFSYILYQTVGFIERLTEIMFFYIDFYSQYEHINLTLIQHKQQQQQKSDEGVFYCFYW